MRSGTVVLVMVMSFVWQGNLYAEATTEDSGSRTDIIWLGKEEIRKQRHYVVASAMRLSEADGEVFWPLYREYWNEITGIKDKTGDLVLEFTENLNSLTEDRSRSMIGEYLSLREEEFELKQKYLPRFSGVLTAKQVLRYFQIENKLDSAINFALTKAVPLSSLE